ncbi:unnamed protein product [Periconia digitata]|uniref:Uncharacterized protein n=1 Tax=Periconia digitata TaxID=1303443 RepID=A0A9W4UB81_9PLEO|nr:unnamed protein product [Periconia digitata]
MVSGAGKLDETVDKSNNEPESLEFITTAFIIFLAMEPVILPALRDALIK